MKAPKRWFRISLFRLLVVISLICVFLATYVRTKIRADAQRNAVLALCGYEPSKNPFPLVNGSSFPLIIGSSSAHPLAKVFYDFETDAYQSGLRGVFAKQPNSWWGKKLGYDFVHNVEIVDFNRPPNKHEIDYLKSLPSVKNVILNHGVSSQSAWRELVQCQSLNRLELSVFDKNDARTYLDNQTVETEESVPAAIVFRDLQRLNRLTELVVKLGDLSQANLNEISKSRSIQTLRLLDIHILREDLLNFPSLPNIQMFCWKIYLNPLDDKEFRFIEKMPNLKTIVMAGNYEITDQAFESLSKLKRLEKISFHGTKFSGSELHRIATLKNLVDIELPASQLNDAALEILSNFVNLERLEIGSTAVSDAGMRHLANLQNLRFLSIRSTVVTDQGLRELENLKNLKYLQVSNTLVTDEGLTHLKKALPACLVDRN